MTVHQMSVLAWITGGVVGSSIATNHRLAGFALGAILVGMVADKAIENRYYPPGSLAAAEHELEMWRRP